MTEGNTRDKLLDAAEHLFAEKGIHQTSTREITSYAGTNLASINYHFGTKESMVEELLKRRILPINEERKRRLSSLLEHAPDEIQVEDIFRAFVEPAIEKLGKKEEKNSFLAIMGQIHTGPETELKGVMPRLMGDTFFEFYSAFCRVLPHLEQKKVMERFMFSIGCMVHALYSHEKDCNSEHPFRSSMVETRLEVLSEDLIQFMSRGMEG